MKEWRSVFSILALVLGCAFFIGDCIEDAEPWYWEKELEDHTKYHKEIMAYIPNFLTNQMTNQYLAIDENLRDSFKILDKAYCTVLDSLMYDCNRRLNVKSIDSRTYCQYRKKLMQLEELKAFPKLGATNSSRFYFYHKGATFYKDLDKVNYKALYQSYQRLVSKKEKDEFLYYLRVFQYAYPHHSTMLLNESFFEENYTPIKSKNYSTKNMPSIIDLMMLLSRGDVRE